MFSGGLITFETEFSRMDQVNPLSANLKMVKHTQTIRRQ